MLASLGMIEWLDDTVTLNAVIDKPYHAIPDALKSFLGAAVGGMSCRRAWAMEALTGQRWQRRTCRSPARGLGPRQVRLTM